MGVQGGIGWMGFATVTVAACLLAYPTLWALRIARDPRIRRNRDPLYIVAATGVVALLIIPASFIDVGWLSVPTLILMLSISHGVVHAEVSRVLTKDSREEPVGVFAGFSVPMLALAVIVLVASVQQLKAAAAAGQMGIAAVGSSVFLSFAVLGVGPPFVAFLAISVGFVRQRRAVRSAFDHPLRG